MNSPVARVFTRLSFSWPCEMPAENSTTGGFVATHWKNEYGAKFGRPCASTVPIQPIGRGITSPVINLYASV